MSDISDSELFSAYLDGELTADEQVRAERMLAVSPEARQLLDELRAVSNGLQGLPQEKLDEDLSARVLQIAERRMLSPEEPNVSGTLREPTDSGTRSVPDTKPAAGRAAAAMSPPTDDASASEGFPWRELSWRGMLRPRALIWSAIVVVVAIFIHFNSPQKPNRELAGLDSTQPAAAAARSKSTSDGSWVGPADRSKKPGDDTVAGNKERRAAIAKSEEGSAPAEEKAADGKPERDRSETGMGGYGEAARKAMPPMPAKGVALADRPAAVVRSEISKAATMPAGAPLLAAKPAAEPAPSYTAKAPMGKDASAGREGVAKMLALRGGGMGGGGMRVDGMGSRAKPGETADETKDAAANLARGERIQSKTGRWAEKKSGPAAETLAANQPPANVPLMVAPLATPLAAPAPAMPATPSLAKSGAGKLNDVAEHRSQVVTVVRLNISSAAVRTGLFNKLLADNGLAAQARLENARQSLARFQNAKADNGSLTVQGTPIPRGGTTSTGGLNRQQQIGQASPETLQPPREMVQNSVSRDAPQVANSQPAATFQQRPATTASNGVSGANVLGGNGQVQAAGAANQSNSAQQNVANTNFGNSAITSNLYGARGGPEPASISCELDASPAQLTALLKDIGRQDKDFSLVEVATSPVGTLPSDALRAADKRGLGESQLDQQTRPGGAVQRAPAKSPRLQQFEADAKIDTADKLREQAAKSPAREAVSGPVPSQNQAKPQTEVAAAKTHVVFVLQVFDNVAPPPAAAVPVVPAAPAKAK